MKVIDMIEQTSARLDSAGVSFGHGTTNAFDEAAWLVLWRLGLPLDALDDFADREVTADEQAAVDGLVAQRIATRKPTAYLTGEAWLQGVPFTVDERVIVPRSLIAETIADGTLDAWLMDAKGAMGGRFGVASTPQAAHVLDLCTGNCSVAVLAALAWPEVRVDATDLSADALSVARLNLQRHDLAGRITLLQGDGLAAVAGRLYRLILCNPPYVNRDSMTALPAEYRAEPALALDGGDDGMDFIQGLLRNASDHLTEDGLLVLEIGHERTNFERAFPGLDVAWLPTSAGDDQVLLIARSALTCVRTSTSISTSAAPNRSPEQQ